MGKKKQKTMCRETEIIGGVEFICVLPYHQREYDNNGKRRPWLNARGDASKWRRHYMKRRYPEGEH